LIFSSLSRFCDAGFEFLAVGAVFVQFIFGKKGSVFHRNMLARSHVKRLPHSVNVLAQRPMIDGVVGLHIEGVRQRQFVQFTGNGGNEGGGNLSPKRKVYIGVGLRVAFGAGAKDFCLGYLIVPTQYVSDQFLFGIAEAKGVHVALRFSRKSCSNR
jgi:hypothetical protein